MGEIGIFRHLSRSNSVNLYSLACSLTPVVFLRELSDCNLRGYILVSRGNPICGWPVDGKADRLLCRFDRCESEQAYSVESSACHAIWCRRTGVWPGSYMA